jgi:hypothetical protein
MQEDHPVPEKPTRDWIPNPDGHPASLQASHPGNLHAARNGLRSARVRAPRAEELAAQLMALPHVAEVDHAAAMIAGDLLALEEALEHELTKCVARMTDLDPADPDYNAALRRLAMLEEMLSRTSRRVLEALGEFGATPRSRAKWKRDYAAGESLAEAARRLRDGKAA